MESGFWNLSYCLTTIFYFSKDCFMFSEIIRVGAFLCPCLRVIGQNTESQRAGASEDRQPSLRARRRVAYLRQPKPKYFQVDEKSLINRVFRVLSVYLHLFKHVYKTVY